jgi:hypothetical protein
MVKAHINYWSIIKIMKLQILISLGIILLSEVSAGDACSKTIQSNKQ